MKKVAVIIPSFAVGGAEVMVSQLITHLDTSRFKVLVIVLYDRVSTHIQKSVDKSGVQVKYLQKRKSEKLRGFWLMYHSLSEFRPDIIHTHLSFIYTVPWILTHKVTAIHTVHCNPYEDQYKRILAYLMRRKKLVQIAISKKNAEELKEIYHTEKIEQIPNPVDAKKFAISNRKIRKKGLVFLCVGRLEPVKNHKLLLESFRRLLEHYPGQKLLLVGDGSCREELEALSKQNGTEQHVIFYGSVGNVEKFYEVADVFVLCSLSEGLPMSVLEAMAAALPVISTNVGGIPDIVKKNGVLISENDPQILAEAMEYMVSHEEERRNMGELGRKMVREFDIDRIVEQYEKIYMKYAR